MRSSQLNSITPMPSRRQRGSLGHRLPRAQEGAFAWQLEEKQLLKDAFGRDCQIDVNLTAMAHGELLAQS